jgi:hypothetical protein
MTEPELVPRGERDDLQRTARETGERMGSMDTLIGQHTDHLAKINGSIGDLATAMAQQATAAAVMAVAVKNIESALAIGTVAAQQRKGLSTQWWIAILAAVVALTIGFMAAASTVVVVLLTH